MTLAERLAPFAGRPTLAAVALMNAITGLVALVVLAPYALGADATTFRDGAIGIAEGRFAYGFLYAPLLGWLMRPLTWMPPAGAALVMSGCGLGILLVGIALETRRHAWIDRLLVGVAVLGFIPVVHELLLGQVTMLLAAAVYPVRDRDGWRRGVALGVALALIPKPMLLPVLGWMLVRRRRALGGMIVTAVAATLAGIVLLGPDLYRLWLEALLGTGQITRNGNLALTSLASMPLELAGLAVVAVAWAWSLVRSERAGFVASAVASTLAVPFAFAYSVSIVLLAVRPALAVMPAATRLLALTANIAVIGPFVAWALAAMGCVAAAAHGDAQRPTAAT